MLGWKKDALSSLKLPECVKNKSTIIMKNDAAHTFSKMRLKATVVPNMMKSQAGLELCTT
jgi:hypothetical protein